MSFRTPPRSAAIAVGVLYFGGSSVAVTQTLAIPIQTELPTLLHTTPENASWVITATLLVGAVALPIAGRVADLFGKRPVLIFSASAMLAGSTVASLSDSLAPLLVGRVFQGLAAGFIPVGISLIREITPPSMSGMATSLMSATLGVGAAIGLPLSAWLVASGDWHTPFWVSAALAAILVLLCVWAVPRTRDVHAGAIDVPGAVGLAAGLVVLLLGVSKGNAWGWESALTIGCLVGGVLLLVAWGAMELRRTDPLVDLRASAAPAVLMTNLAAVAIGFGMMSNSIVAPQLLQMPTATGYGLGQTLPEAGLWLAPAGLTMMLVAPISSRLMGRFGSRNTLALGAAIVGIGYLVGYAFMDEAWQVMLAGCVSFAGVGIGYAAMPTLILDNTPVAGAGSAVGVNALARFIGTTSASAVMVALMHGHSMSLAGERVPGRAGFELCYLAAAAAAFIGVCLALLAPRHAPSRPDVEAPGVEIALA